MESKIMQNLELPDLRPQGYGGYNGNTNLKKAGLELSWTPEHIKEYIKCARDPVYFTKNYMKLVHLDRGLVKFDLYPYQEKALIETQRNNRMILLTSRQAGKTSFATAYILHTIIFNEHKAVALLANKGDTAREILSRVQLAYEHLPFWLQQGVIEWNKGSMELENGCSVIAAATSGGSIRGKSINVLYIDEAAFVEGYDEFFASVYPTISSGEDTKLILTSTPNGLNHFYHIWQGAIDPIKPNGYYPLKVLWTEVPGRDAKWKEETLKALNYNQEKFNVEYEAEFMGSSGTLINGATLKRLHPAQPLTTPKDGLTQYEAPIPGHIYTLVADVSRGKGLDYSAFHVIDITEMPFRQVVTYRNNLITPLDYAATIYSTAGYYNTAMVLIETNDIGGQVVDSLHYDFEYENIIQTKQGLRGIKEVTSGYGGASKERGIRTTERVRNIGCQILKLLVEQDKLKIIDSNTISELSVFSRKNESFKFEAEAGYNDDLVMGLVLFSWFSDQKFFKNMNNIETLQAARDETDEQLYAGLSGIGIRYDGTEEFYEKFDEDDKTLWKKADLLDDETFNDYMSDKSTFIF